MENNTADIIKNQHSFAKPKNEQDDEIDLLAFLYLLKSKIVIILILFILGGVCSGVYTKFFITPTYAATTKLYVVSASSDSLVNFSDLQVGTSLTADYEQLLLARPILENVINNLGLEDKYTYNSIQSTISIVNPDDTRILKITVTTTNPQYSMDIANELANQAVEKLGDMMNSTPPNIFETAVYPENKASPNTTKNIMVGCIAVPFVYIAILFVAFILDNKIKDEDDIEKYLGMPPIGTIPDLNSKGKKKK